MRISKCAFLINSMPARGGNWAKGVKVLAPFVAMLCLTLWPMEASAKHKWGLEHKMEPYIAPVALKPHSWSGVYVGVGAGAGSFDYGLWGHATKSKRKEKRKCNGRTGDGGCRDPGDWYEREGSYDYPKDIHVSDDDWNIFGTVQVGIDHQIGQHFVIGAFADFDLYTDSGSSFSMPWVNPTREHYEMGSLSSNVELDSVWSIGGRIGALVTPQFLLYGMGGYTQANLDANQTLVLNDDWGTQTLSVNLPDELHGYFVGVGGEYKLRDNMSLKVEYRYSDFDSVSASVSKTYVDQHVHCGCYEHRTTRGREADAELDAELHSVRVALVFRLGDQVRPIEPLK